MSNITFFLIFIPILSTILLVINFILAPHKPNKDKDAQFECGFSSFTQMSRLPFSISFFVYALLFLLFDLEILLVYPYVVSAYNNSIYGLIVMLVFFILLTIGFIFELGKKALQIDSRQSDVSLPKVSLSKSLNLCFFYIWPFLCLEVYRKYPMICVVTLYVLVWISCQVFSPHLIYCDSSSDSEPEIVFKDKGKGREVIVESSPSDNDNANSASLDKGKVKCVRFDLVPTYSDADPNADVKGKGKQVSFEAGPSTAVTSTDTDTNRDESRYVRPGDSTSNIPNRPFTMTPDLQNFWENVYDDDDRRRHLTAIDRLGFDPREWVGTGNMSENIEAIKTTMETMRNQEVDDQIVARKMIESLQEEEDQVIARKIAESLQEEEDAIARKIAESLQEEDEAILRQVAESIEGSEDVKKRKLEEFLKNDESIARKMQKSLDEGDAADSDDDSSDNYSVLSSIRGDESPNTYQKKLEVLEVEFNLKKKK